MAWWKEPTPSTHSLDFRQKIKCVFYIIQFSMAERRARAPKATANFRRFGGKRRQEARNKYRVDMAVFGVFICIYVRLRRIKASNDIGSHALRVWRQQEPIRNHNIATNDTSCAARSTHSERQHSRTRNLSILFIVSTLPLRDRNA